MALPNYLNIFFKIGMLTRAILHFHVNFRLCSSISTEMAVGHWISLALNLEMNLENIAVSPILGLPAHKHRMSLYLFKSSLFTFNNFCRVKCTILIFPPVVAKTLVFKAIREPERRARN